MIEVGATIRVRIGDEVKPAKVRRIGSLEYAAGSRHRWAMLTLDVGGECMYAAARENELLEGSA